MLYLLPLSADTYAAFRANSLARQTDELIQEEHYSPGEAALKAETDLRSMLPQDLSTPGNYLYTVFVDYEDVGYLWFLKEEHNGVTEAFLCDFFISPSARRNGYGKAALERYHDLAAKSECSKCILFVANSNIPAQKLYEKCGYVFLRKHNYGRFMIKEIRKNTASSY